MGSWAELDARYEAGSLTPALVLLVALTHTAGSSSVYSADGSRAPFLPATQSLGCVSYAQLLQRAEAYLQSHSVEQFLREAPPLLNHEQKICMLANMADIAQRRVAAPPEEQPFFRQALAAFAVDAERVNAYQQESTRTHNLEIFPQ
jgi:hypothetical protein